MKVLKFIVTFIIVLAGAVFLTIALSSEMLPEGTMPLEADRLADKMLLSVNDAAWQKTGAVSWGYRQHNFIWDKRRHLAKVEFDNNVVLIDINKRKGEIVQGGDGLTQSAKVELCNKAWKLWVNDSFWLNPISKSKDPGTTRKLVKLSDGREGLMVSYETGGATPGDSYVWLLDENSRPKAWKFWVSIIPVKGMEFTWDGWTKLSTGAWVSTIHEGVSSLPIVDPKGFLTLEELTNGEDIFKPLDGAEIYF